MHPEGREGREWTSDMQFESHVVRTFLYLIVEHTHLDIFELKLEENLACMLHLLDYVQNEPFVLSVCRKVFF